MPSVTACAIDRETTEFATFNSNTLGTEGIYTLRYQVVTDGVLGPVAVVNGATSSSPHPLPSMWATYSYQGSTDSGSYLQEVRVERDPATVLRYFVTGTWRPPESLDEGGAPPGAEPDPLSRSPVFWWDREVLNWLIEEDKDGKPFVNPIGEMYDQTVELPRARGVLVVEYNVATLAEVIFYSRKFEFAVNSVPWSIGGVTIPERNALCRDVSSGPPQTENGVTFYRLSFRFVFQFGTNNWDHGMVNRSWFYWKKAGEAYEKDDEEKNERFPFGGAPGLILHDGTRAPDYIDPLTYDKNTVWTWWRLRPEENFNTLPFSG